MWRYRRTFGSRTGHGLMRLDDALHALGKNADMGRHHAEVPLANVVGTVDRSGDFDQNFRLLNRSLYDRWRRMANALESGFEPPPVELIQLGELYFVGDGHHRVSVARELGRVVITARVRRICTTAYGMGCLRLVHLPSKAAERGFLERIPLPDEVRTDLWLDEPADWMRLADAAEAWAMRRLLEGPRPPDRREFAGAWWEEEVMPLLARLRSAGVGLDQRDVEVYMASLRLRDRLGHGNWPADLTDLDLMQKIPGRTFGVRGSGLRRIRDSNP
jgi:hypothetical protein